MIVLLALVSWIFGAWVAWCWYQGVIVEGRRNREADEWDRIYRASPEYQAILLSRQEQE